MKCLEEQDPPPACAKHRLDAAEKHLQLAEEIIKCAPAPRSAWTGVDVERAWVNVHAVEVTLIRLSDPTAVAAKLPEIIGEAEQVLNPDDLRRKRLGDYAKKKPLLSADRAPIAELAEDVYAAVATEHVRARSFRNILFSATLALTLFAIVFGILGSLAPSEVSLCAPNAATQAKCPSGLSQPSGGDVWVTEFLGLFSASLVGAVAIRRMRGTSTPYAVPMASLLLKLPTGALTAVGGLLLVRAGILGPAVASADTAQLVAYALLFGASQQAFTRLIDRQAQSVLDSIPSADRDPAKKSKQSDDE